MVKEIKEFGPWSEQTSSSGRKYFYNRDTEVIFINVENVIQTSITFKREQKIPLETHSYFIQKIFADCKVSQWEKPKEWREYEQRLAEQERLAVEQERLQQQVGLAKLFILMI
ncbi:hypothetical protein NECAME_07207 [Necator americanus]|uniref:WW domain-containing protein n=1 Tax=Necator americanus TaxID=51031 RepID=W2TQ52_NECAM|nr:hypothetical protein NECAME_07207 [Necator americanus]ETN83779.1 hypothetical protein NECAME_07207 [Necator americanus]